MDTAPSRVPSDILCIDCGCPVSPVRRDGEPGRHHRCDPCFRAWARRRNTRRRLDRGPWTFWPGAEGDCCSDCGAQIPARRMRFLFGEGGDKERLCDKCVKESGWLERLHVDPRQQLRRAVEKGRPPAIQSAVVKMVPGADLGLPPTLLGRPRVIMAIPPGVPALSRAAVSLLQHLAQSAVAVGGIRCQPQTKRFAAFVAHAPDIDRAAVDVAALCAWWLTRVAADVEVPREHYREIRESVYWNGGKGLAGRLRRVRRNPRIARERTL